MNFSLQNPGSKALLASLMILLTGCMEDDVTTPRDAVLGSYCVTCWLQENSIRYDEFGDVVLPSLRVDSTYTQIIEVLPGEDPDYIKLLGSEILYLPDGQFWKSFGSQRSLFQGYFSENKDSLWVKSGFSYLSEYSYRTCYGPKCD